MKIKNISKHNINLIRVDLSVYQLSVNEVIDIKDIDDFINLKSIIDPSKGLLLIL